MPINTFSAGAVITAAGHNENWALAVLTDTARTISVTHTYTASQTFTGGWTAAAACTVSSGGIAVTGNSTVAGTVTITSTSASALTVGANGATNPVLKLDASTASVATGISITGAAAASGAAIAVISSGTNENLTLDAKGSGTITIAGTSTGEVKIQSPVDIIDTSTPQLQIKQSETDHLSIHVGAFGNVDYVATGDTPRHIFGGVIEADDGIYIGDSANANVTLGLTINQGAATDQIFALKNSGVAHGVTDIAETDTMAHMTGGASGGITFESITEGSEGMLLGSIVTTEITTKSTAAAAAVQIRGKLKSGTGAGGLTTVDSNLLAILNSGTTRFIFDIEGTFHADVGSTTF